jgi:hypothetical protein
MFGVAKSTWLRINFGDRSAFRYVACWLSCREGFPMKLKFFCVCVLVNASLHLSFASVFANTPTASSPAKQICLPMSTSDTSSAWTEGQKQLGMGLTAFDEGQLAAASERIKRALRAGLDVPLELAVANKYLALIYCTNRSLALCKKHFEEAIAASPEITFDSTELRTSFHRQTLTEAQSEVARKNTVREPKLVQSQRELPQNELAVRSAKSKSGETGTVRLDIRPWAQVFINNRAVAFTPPSKSLTLAAGEHRLEIRNPAGPTYRADVVVPVGGSVDLAHRF